MLAALCIGLLTLTIVFQRWTYSGLHPRLPRPLDLGLVLVWIAFMYSAFPTLGILLAGLDVGFLHDERSEGRIPPDADVARVGVMYLLFIAGFAGAYRLSLAGRRSAQPEQTQRSSLRDVAVALGLVVAIKLAILLTRSLLGVQTAQDYLDSYLELAGQSVIVRQLYGILIATELAAVILAIVVVVAHNPRLHGIVALVVIVQIVFAMLGGGSRSQAFLCVLAYVVARSLYDARLHLRSIMAVAAGGLLLFLAAGAIRHAGVASDDISSLYLLQGGEFMSVFYNALDLQQRTQDVDLGFLRVGLYLVDLLRFIPQQFVGDLKLDPATVYVSTFYPDFSEAGGGLAFGAIAEATLGFGPLEALVRGLLLGYAFARVRGACLRPYLSLARAFIYTWFVVLAYQSLRDTTFSVFPRFFFQVVPLLAVVWLTGALRSKRLRSLVVQTRKRPARRQPLRELPGTP